MEITSILYPMMSIGGLGLLFGAGLGYASKKFAVKVDPRVEQIKECLPGANCGGCGMAGCEAFAKAVVEGKVPPNGCPVSGIEVAEKIGSIMGLAVEAAEKNVAVVKCAGTRENAKEKYEYYGIEDCRDAAMIPGAGSKACSYGCLGLGSCVKACPFDAIEIKDGVATVNEEKCTACGNCVKTCPRDLIELMPADQKQIVYCNSKDKGKDVKQACKVGCIGCRLCTKVCEYDAITVKDNLAYINPEKCTNCGACVQKCPTGAIKQQIKNIG